MLQARRRPVAGSRKRVPVVAAEAPKARSFGPRKKVVAAARKSLRLGLVRLDAPLAGGTTAVADGLMAATPPEASDESSGVEWVKDIDWGGTPLSSPEPVPRMNGHGHSGEFIPDLPPPSALPPVTPEARSLN